jgi:hypothetical protein
MTQAMSSQIPKITKIIGKIKVHVSIFVKKFATDETNAESDF